MRGSLQIAYDRSHDVYVAHPRWTVETEDDCKVWFEQYARLLGPKRRRVDLVIVLDDFHIGNGIGAIWGRYRAEMIRRFTRFSVRVHADTKVATFVATSSVQHGVTFDQATDIESAIALIERRRVSSG